MVLSDFDKIVVTEWFESFKIRKELHLHAIVEIFHNETNITVINAIAPDDGNTIDNGDAYGTVSAETMRITAEMESSSFKE